MAKKARTTKALQGPRQLKLMVGPYFGIYEDGVGFPAYGGWNVLASGGAPYFEGSIDVNLALDDLTMFPQSAILQDPGIYYRTPAASLDPVNSYQIIDIISVKRLDVEELYSNLIANQAAPGMIGTTDDFNQIIMGTWRLMASNNTLGAAGDVQTTIDVKDFSSASPFAQDRLWCYRMAITITSDLTADRLLIPSSRFILQVIVAQEDDMPYMMRLKNSYELQQL